MGGVNRRVPNGLASAREQQRRALDAVAPFVRGTPVKRGAPPFNALDAKALRYFRHFVDTAPDDHFVVTDVPLLEEYSRLLAVLDSNRDEFTRAPLVAEDRFGQIRPNPTITSYLKIQAAAFARARELRLQPAMRPVPPSEQAGTINAVDGDGDVGAQSTPMAKRAHLMFGGARAAAQFDEDED